MNKDLLDTRKNIALALSIICLIMAFYNVLQPILTRPSGRWAFFFGPIWDIFGWHGLVFYWILLTVIFFLIFIKESKK
jgi:hypothetical protein